jgi:hypothetical protein
MIIARLCRLYTLLLFAVCGSLFAQSGGVCSSQAAVTFNTAGTTQIVAAPSGGSIRICHLSFAGPATANIQFVSGTGANCGTGTANISGLYQNVSTLAFNLGIQSPITVPAGQGFCISSSNTTAFGGLIVYTVF